MRGVGWVLFAATCVLVALQGFMLAAASDSLLSSEVFVDLGFPLVGIGSVVGAAVGALIISRYPRNSIGWLFCIGQLGNAIAIAAQAFAVLVARCQVDAPLAGRVALYLANLFDATYTVAFLAVIFMIAPDGRLPSRRWRLGVVLAVVAVLLHDSVVFAVPAGDFVPGTVTELGALTIALLIASSVALMISIVLGAVALWLRLRRATGDRRLQLRWIATSAAGLAGTFVLLWVGDLFLSPVPWLLEVLLYLAYIGVSVAVGVAILRYRLYDIDVILSRAIVLGTLAAFVTVGYVAVVVAIGSVLAAVGVAGSGLYWPSLVATALVAAAFQPLRRHVLRLADRLVYGDQAVPYEALADLSRRLADSASPDELPERVAESAGRAVGAERTRVLLGAPGDAASVVATACWPDPSQDSGRSPSVEIPVLDRGEQVGSIAVVMPPGRTLRPAERQLLDDFAAQAGIAFRNAMLQTELAARVREVDLRSKDLLASRRRLVGAEDEEHERLAGAIQRRVVPHLSPVVDELSGETDVHSPSLPRTLEQLIAQTEGALEELRTVCRGVFPALLQRRGLVPALYAQLDATHPAAALEVDQLVAGRLDPAIEAAAYLFCIEVAPTEDHSVIRLEAAGDRLVADVRRPNRDGARDGGDDSANGADRADGDGGDNDAGARLDAGLRPEWQHAADRVDALNGDISVEDAGAGSITVRAMIPIDGVRGQAERERLVTAQVSSSRSGPNADLGM